MSARRSHAAALSAMLAASLLGAAAAAMEGRAETGASCSAGGSGSARCLPQDSVLLQRSHRRAAAHTGEVQSDDKSSGNRSSSGSSGSTGSRSQWDGGNMKMTHYWDCSGQGCDASTLQPWNIDRYITPPGYGPQDPADFGGARYGERMWLTGAASDALSALMGPDDGCCGGDPNDGGVGGCGKCLLIQNPDTVHPDWTAVVMKKNRCPPNSHGCGANQPHFDIAAPGFDNLQWSTANVCGIRPGTGFASQRQSETLGRWYKQCANTAECQHLCDGLPAAFQRGCRLFASWGWRRGDPDRVKFRAVECPRAFVNHVGSLFGANGPALSAYRFLETA